MVRMLRDGLINWSVIFLLLGIFIGIAVAELKLVDIMEGQGTIWPLQWFVKVGLGVGLFVMLIAIVVVSYAGPVKLLSKALKAFDD